MPLIALALLAVAPVPLGDDPTFLGWTKDGNAFAWTHVERAYVVVDDEMVLSETATIGAVHDLRTAKTEHFALEVKHVRKDAEGTFKKRYGAGNKAAFDAWKKDHPLVLKKGAGPKGAATDLTVDGESQWDWSSSTDMKIVLIVTRAGLSAKAAFDDGPSSTFIPDRSAEPYWDPTGRRVAFLIQNKAAQTMRGVVPRSAEIHLVAVPPRVEVVAPARLSAAAAKAAEAIEAAGTAVVAVGVATKDRTATVVYANAPHEALAKQLAAALPGATVEKLTWKPNAEIVVAIGAPAQ